MFKNIFAIIFFVFCALFSSGVNAASNDMCGLKPIDLSAEEIQARGLDGEQYIPDERNYDICEEDVAYKTYYLLFQEAINQPIVSGIFDSFTNLNESFKTKAEIVNIAGPAMMAIYAFTWVVFIFVAISFAVSTLLTISKGSMRGEFFGREFNGFKPAFSLFLGVIAVFPVGIFTLGQLTVIIAGLFALAMGNLVYSAFLYATGVKSADITIADSVLYSSAESQAVSLIMSNLVADRTKRAVASYNFSSYNGNGFLDSVYSGLAGVSDGLAEGGQVITDSVGAGLDFLNSSTGGALLPINTASSLINSANSALKSFTDGGKSEIAFDNDDVRFINGHVNYCVGSAWNKTKTNDYIEGQLELGSLSLNSFSRCTDYQGRYINNQLRIDTDIHGYRYGSGVINYGENKIMGSAYEKTVLTQTKDDVQDTIVQEVIERAITDSSSIVASFSSVEKYKNILEKLKGIAAGTPSEPIFSINSSVVPDLQADITESVRSTYGSFKSEFDSKFSESEKAKMQGIYLYALHYTAMKALMGGYESASNNQKIILHKNDNKTIISSIINDETNVAAKKLETAFCYKNADKMGEINLLRKDFNGKSATDEDVAEDFYDEALTINGLFECIDTEIVSGNQISIDFITREAGLNSGVFEGLFDENNKINVAYSEALKSESSVIMDNVRKEHYLPLTYYIYTIKKATAESLSDMVKNETDKEMVNSLRKRGWLSFSSYLLEISQIQAMSSNYIEEIVSFFSASTQPTGDSVTGSYHVNLDAFYKDAASEDDKKFPAQLENFSPMNLNSFWVSASKGGNIDKEIYTYQNDTSLVQEVFNEIMDSVQEVVFTPTDPLRQMFGAETGETLKERLEGCVDSAEDCVPQVHPLNAVTSFGHELIGVGVFFKLFYQVINGLMSAIDLAIDVVAGAISGGNKSLKGALNALGKVGGFIVKAVIIAVYAVASLFNGIADILILAGVFLGYIVPLIPFIATLVAFMGWIVSILVGLLVIVVWPALWSIPKNEGNEGRVNFKSLWALYGQILLKPSILVIALAFAWVLCNVIIFSISILLSVVFSSVESATDGIISYMFDQLMFYITISVLIFITLSYAFKIVNKLTDEFFKKTGIDQASDQQLIDSLAFERAMQAMAVKEVATNVLDTPQKYVQDRERLRRIKEARERERAAKNRDQIDPEEE